MEMKKVLRCVASLVAAVVLLGACAGPGTRVEIPLTMPKGEKATIYAHDQQVPDWMLDGSQLAVNFMVKGNATAEQLAAVAEAEKACRIYTKTVRPSKLVAVVSNGALYAAAGYIGAGLGARAYLPRVDTKAYARYGENASGFSGAASGIINTGGQTYTFENCGREVFILFPNYSVRVLAK